MRLKTHIWFCRKHATACKKIFYSFSEFSIVIPTGRYCFVFLLFLLSMSGEVRTRRVCFPCGWDRECLQCWLNVPEAVIGSTLLLSQWCKSPSEPLFFLRELSFYPCLPFLLCVLKRTSIRFSLGLSFRKASETLLSRSKAAGNISHTLSRLHGHVQSSWVTRILARFSSQDFTQVQAKLGEKLTLNKCLDH